MGPATSCIWPDTGRGALLEVLHLVLTEEAEGAKLEIQRENRMNVHKNAR